MWEISKCTSETHTDNTDNIQLLNIQQLESFLKTRKLAIKYIIPQQHKWTLDCTLSIIYAPNVPCSSEINCLGTGKDWLGLCYFSAHYNVYNVM